MYCCFNWADTPVTLRKRIYTGGRLADFWTGASLGRLDNYLTVENIPAHSARLLECVDA
jgi:hypothetical protein